MASITHSECPLCGSVQIQDIEKIKDHSHTGEEFMVSKCTDCDFHFTQNAPDAASIGPYYKSENYVSHSDTQKGLFFKAYHMVRNYMLKKKRKLVEQSASQSQGNLLDIGTGTGYFPNEMKQSGWKVQGIEQDPDTRKYASEKFGFEVHDTTQLNKFEADQFDAVTMWHVLEHVHDLNGYIQQIHSILKEDGVFVVAVPNHKSFDAEFYGKNWAAWDIPIHLWHFHPETMKKLMEKHSFEVQSVLPMPFDAVYVSMLSEQYKSGTKIPGLFKGINFALNGKYTPERCSSVIYVIKKK